MLVEKRFDTGEVVLNYAEGPPNGPPIVLLPGGTMRWQDCYNALIPLLTPRWQIYAVNHRGHGKSGRIPNHYRLKDYARDVVSFINHLEEPAVLLAHSMGGIISVGAAAKLKDKLSALILCDPPITNQSNLAWVKAEAFQEGFKGMVEMLKTCKTVDEIAKTLGGESISPSTYARAQRFYQLDVEVIEFLLKDRLDEWVQDYDLDGFLKEISCPVCLLQADQVEMGQAMTDSDVAYAKSVISEVYHVKIDDFSHELGLEFGYIPRQVANEIMGFLVSIR